MKLLDFDGPLMTALGKFADVVILNILFILCSVPVFTIGASLTAMHRCIQTIVEDEEEGLIFKDFFIEFKRNFKKATLLWLICMAIIAFLFFYYFLVTMFSGAFGKTYIITFFVLTLVFLFGLLYIFPLQSRYENTVKNTLKNAWMVSIMAFPWTLVCIAILLAAAGLSYMIILSGGYIIIFIWLICGFGLVAYMHGLVFKKVFEKITPPITVEYEKPAEALFTDEDHRKGDLMTMGSSFSNPYWNQREEKKTDQSDKQGKGSAGNRRRSH